MANTKTDTNVIVKDFYGIPIKIGDIVTFPAGKDLMDGVVEKFRPKTRLVNDPRYEVFVKNSSGYKKWKDNTVVINRSRILDSIPEFSV